MYTQSCVLHRLITCFRASLLKYPLIGESTLKPSCSNDNASNAPSVIIQNFSRIPSDTDGGIFDTLSVSFSGGLLTIRSIASRCFGVNV